MRLNIYMLLLNREKRGGSTFLIRGFKDLRSCCTKDAVRREGIGCDSTDPFGGAAAKFNSEETHL
jgi:hypothetical protein